MKETIVKINESGISFLEEVSVRRKEGRVPILAYGEAAPIGYSEGEVSYEISIVRLLPFFLEEGERESAFLNYNDFTITVTEGGRSTQFLSCFWADCTEKRDKDGICQTYKAISYQKGGGA